MFGRKSSRTAADVALLRKLGRGVNHAEGDLGINEVDVVMPVQTQDKLMRLGPGKYNPPYIAQIQLQAIKLYFSENAGVYTPVAAGSVPGALDEALPVFMFANADFAAGYAKMQSQYPLANWTYQPPVVMGKTVRPGVAYSVFDSNVLGQLRAGDVVLPYIAASGGTNYVALQIIRSSDVPYATLLDATNSNTFKTNLLRYTVDPLQLSQFTRAIMTTDETMFGKFTSDTINPESSKNPEQNQTNIIDIDLFYDINKQKGLATLAGTTVVSFTWNIFVSSVTKVV